MTHIQTRDALRRSLLVLAVLTTVLLARDGSAQSSLTGAIHGRVRDEQGGAIAGATVTVSSPSLLEGSRPPASTDTRGRFDFRALPVGTYTVTVEMAMFAKWSTDGVSVQIGTPTDVRVALIANQTVTVHAYGRDTAFVTNIGANDIIFGRLYADGLVRAPGMSPSSQGSPFLSSHGAGIDHNSFFKDGTNITATTNRIARSEPALDAIAMTEVVSMGASAEYGNAQGAFINFVMRTGGSDLLWEGAFYGQPGSWASQPLRRPINGTGDVDSGYERHRYRGFSTTLGGPIVDANKRFFVAFERLRDEDSQPGADPAYPKQYASDKAFGKVSWQPARGWDLFHSFQQEFWDNRELPTDTKRFEATQRLEASVQAFTLGHLTGSLSANSVLDVSAGLLIFSQDITRSAGESAEVGRLDRQTNVMTGAPQTVGEIEQSRWTAKAAVTKFAADHDLKFGTQLDRGQHRSLLTVPEGVRYEDNVANTATGIRAFYSGPSNAGGRVVTASLFVTDTFRIGDRVTLTSGLRFDHSRGISPDLDELDKNGQPIGQIQGDGTIYTGNVFSPRVDIVVHLTADGTTILRSSAGRLTQGILTGELSPDHPGVATITRYDVDATTGALTNVVGIDPRANVQIDPDTRIPTTDAFSIGLDRDITKWLSLGVGFAHKTGRDQTGWYDRGGTYSVEDRVVDDQTIPIHFLKSPPTSRLFTITNPDGYSLDYNALSVTFHASRGVGQISGNYTFAQSTGLQPSSGTTAAGAQVATIGAPPVSFAPPVTFGRDPNTVTNADGSLPNERPHVLHVMGTTVVPKIDVMIGVHVQHASGKPWARVMDITPTQAQESQRVLLEQRGSRRLSSQTVWDMRISKAFRLSGVGHFDVGVDILNATNDTAEESIVTDMCRWDPATTKCTNNPGFGVGNVFLIPRRVMWTVKVTLGK